MKFILITTFIFFATICIAQAWESVPFSVNWTPRVFYEDTTAQMMYIGGEFSTVNGVPCNRIVAYDGTSYYLLQPERWIPSPCLAITKFQNEIYAGGFGGLSKWNGNTWTTIDSGLGIVRGLFNYNNKLLVTGTFDDDSLGGYYSTAALWDGTNWSNFLGIDTIIGWHTNTITSFKVFQNQLYLGGNIDHLGAINEIVRFNGNQWTEVGGGINGIGDEWVDDMEIFNGELYVAGRFSIATGGPGNNIAKWNGTTWQSVSLGLQNVQVLDLMVYNSELWAVGKFSQAGTIPAQYLAKWDGTKWCSVLNSTFDNGVVCLGTLQGDLYIGGAFKSINGNNAHQNIQKLVSPQYLCENVSNIYEETLRYVCFYPNPAQDRLQLELNQALLSQGFTLSILDSQGKTLYQGKCEQANLSLNLQGYATGTYYVVLENKEQKMSTKFVKE